MTTNAMPPDARPAIVLLHSSMSSRNQWSDLSAQLEASFRCIAVDLLGYGKSPFPDVADGAAFTLAHEVDAVNAAIAAKLAPGESFHLVGHSYGGVTALRLARQMRERVLSLAVFEPVAFHLLAANDAARVEIETVVAAIGDAATPRDATRVFIDYWNRAGAFDSLPGAQQDKFTAQIEKVKLDFQALLGEPATLVDMAGLDMPALVMSGLNSPASTRRLAERLAAALPNASAVQTKGGHMGPITHGQVVNALIASFLVGAEVVSV
ncbi:MULTISPECIES: alpha/beta fold hydrolase [unclassified Janthinobacterium]|uniref:alpha/beta fold hydrolase n=1 Tax=unclassified Janthinobacterium TaxID=2610881 RepID=UPI00034C5095|nr:MULTISPECIES: alpha/beta hydrolase [unclassified Janthinobacterium]MEC5163127.1 pimeloyl-ACP methyl ester carboxylesterase [Janthinobacterium sp. CG_S6]